jgi:hypothetical protein
VALAFRGIMLLAGLAFGVAAFAADRERVLDEEIGSYAHQALSRDRNERLDAVDWLVKHGDSRAVAPLIQLMRWLPEHNDLIDRGLVAITGRKSRGRWADWMVWQQEHPEIKPYDGFTALVADILALIDPRFGRFVRADLPFDIRVEEIVWGGVHVDGIPALDRPAMVTAAEASYLNRDDLVFGVEINGDARAYPLRVMNWHEMANDVVGGVPVSLAYCTLCGAGILYDGRVAERPEAFTFGSSGLLYRSNKLMYDRQTDSLWDQFTGEPVSGALHRSSIRLTVLPVVTASWARWQSQHPHTKVLAIDTGYQRDYGPGVAYREYFASPDLMFPASLRSEKLAQKDVVFGVRAPGGVKAWPLSEFAPGRVINDRVGLLDVVVFGDGATRTVRAYERRGRRFTAGADGAELREAGRAWKVTEATLVAPTGETLPRLPGHLAYWFAWVGNFEAATLGED